MIDSKLYYSISEVCQMTGLKDSVLRYWESEIPKMRPKQSRSSKKRMYTKKDIELILRAKQLIYEEKLSIQDAKAKIAEERAGKKTVTITAVESDADTGVNDVGTYVNDINTNNVNVNAEGLQTELALEPAPNPPAPNDNLLADIRDELRDILAILES